VGLPLQVASQPTCSYLCRPASLQSRRGAADAAQPAGAAAGTAVHFRLAPPHRLVALPLAAGV